jgi:hypothetical protein
METVRAGAHWLERLLENSTGKHFPVECVAPRPCTSKDQGLAARGAAPSCEKVAVPIA